MARFFGAGGVAKKKQYLAVADGAQVDEIRRLVVDGMVVELKIRSVDHVADRSFDENAEIVGNVVIHAEKFHFKRPQLKAGAVVGGFNVQFRAGRKIILTLEDDGARERRGDHSESRMPDFFNDVGNGPDVVIVSVGENRADDIFDLFFR